MTIYQQMKAKGVPMANHESDLYVKVTPESTAIVNAYKFRSNVTCFRSQICGTQWYDVPFAYDPFWNKVYAKSIL